MVFQFPNRSGVSHHGAPVRKCQAVASTTRRRSTGGRPVSAAAGNTGPITAHTPSEITSRDTSSRIADKHPTSLATRPSAAERIDGARLGLSDTLDQEATSGDGLDLYDAETEALYRLERDVMSAAFAVRRLIGMPSKVTKATREAKATVIRYPLRPGAKAPDIWDALGDLEMYQMGAPFCHRCRRE